MIQHETESIYFVLAILGRTACCTQFSNPTWISWDCWISEISTIHAQEEEEGAEDGEAGPRKHHKKARVDPSRSVTPTPNGADDDADEDADEDESDSDSEMEDAGEPSTPRGGQDSGKRVRFAAAAAKKPAKEVAVDAAVDESSFCCTVCHFCDSF